MEQLDYGSTLLIRLTDRTGEKVFYTEPFTLVKYQDKFKEALVTFEENAYDAIKSLRQDIAVKEKFLGLSNSELLSEVRRRGL